MISKENWKRAATILMSRRQCESLRHGPQLDGRVPSGSDQEFAVGRELHLHRLVLALIDRQQPARRSIPELGGAILTSGGQELAIFRPADRADRASVSLEI